MFWYLATVYTSHPDGFERAFIEASENAALLVRHGLPIFCPIAHTHPMSVHGGLPPTGHDFWMRVDEPFVEAAHGLIVCKMPNWENSRGIAHEIKKFTAARKRVVWMRPGMIPGEFL